MKKVLNLVKKRQSSSHSSTPEGSRSTPNLSANSRASITSVATSSILQFQSPSKSLGDVSLKSKYNNFTTEKSGKNDKSLSKLHLAVCNENLDKVKKYVKRGFDPDLQDPNPESSKTKRRKSILGKEENLVNRYDLFTFLTAVCLCFDSCLHF